MIFPCNYIIIFMGGDIVSSSRKKIIAVVTALANGFAEKELLRGIISENMKNGYATVVFSNIYNNVYTDDKSISEQKIYDLAMSEDISGVILLCESFVEKNIRCRIASILKNKNVPIIGIGTRLDEFDGLDMELLNTNDIGDIEEITTHLIEKHGFTDIAFLSGIREIETSQLRVQGFISALEKHGIAHDSDKIYYGDFWLNSGEMLAMRYVSGEIAMPQAVICANDMMAYGMLRCFSENHINVPEQITVVSYEYSDMRMYYSPPLTSFRRNRKGLGKAAAERMHCRLSGIAPPEYIAPHGSFVFGSTCPCPQDTEHSLSELKDAERSRTYNDLCLFSSMDQQLTLCRDMDEFIHTIGDHHWMIEKKQNIYLCLYSDWYDPVSESSEALYSRSILYWGGDRTFETEQYDLQTFFEREKDAAVCYFTPVFTGSKYFGHMTLVYNIPESYDDVYRHWLKSVSIGLEFLRLKNDMRYLLSCQSVSEYKDTLTGMNNEKGFRRAFGTFIAENKNLSCLIMLHIDLFPRQFSEDEVRRKTEALLSASKAVAKMCKSSGICAHIKNSVFVCAVRTEASPEIAADLMSSVLIQEKVYMEYAGMDSYTCSAVRCDSEDIDDLMNKVTDGSVKEYSLLTEKRRNKYYSEMLDIRNMIYSSPELTFSSDSDHIFTDSINSFRRKYKSCFGTAFHQDCINARIARMKYHLAVTTDSTVDIAEKCGYIDEKYMQRQFSLNTGMTFLQYRKLFE